MRFTIDLKKTNDIFDEEHYRMRQDGIWRAVKEKDDKIKTSDRVFTSLDEANVLIEGRNIKIELNGEEIVANKSELTFGEDITYWRLRPEIHRNTKPEIPSREEFMQVMTSANVETLNILVIDLNGHFKMLTPDENGKHQRQYSGYYIAVIHEFFSPETGYVGPEIIEHKDFLENVYLNMLRGWHEHLKGNEFKVYIDMHTALKEEKLIEDINEAIKHLS